MGKTAGPDVPALFCLKDKLLGGRRLRRDVTYSHHPNHRLRLYWGKGPFDWDKAPTCFLFPTSAGSLVLEPKVL